MQIHLPVLIIVLEYTSVCEVVIFCGKSPLWPVWQSGQYEIE